MTRDLFARALAHADATVQAAFLNDFCDELAIACRKSYIGNQTYYLAEHLKPQTVEILNEIGGDFENHVRRDAEHALQIEQKRTELRDLERQIGERRKALEDY